MTSKVETSGYRQKLLTLLRRLDADEAQLREEAHLAHRPLEGKQDPLDPLDTSEPQDEDVTFGLLRNEEHLLGEVMAALGRLDQGIFGSCERCGHAISKTRLNAIPYARLCLQCARGQEK